MKWHRPAIDKQSIRDLSASQSIDPLIAAILYRRNLVNDRSIMHSQSVMQHSPFLLPNVVAIVECLLRYQYQKKRLFLIGDRDVDGTTSTALMVRLLNSLNIPCCWKVPCDNEPYGLTNDVVDECVANDCDGIICLDCGTNNIQQVNYALKHNLDIIVIDHHNISSNYSDVDLILNPKIQNSQYPQPLLSTCVLVYKLQLAILLYQSSLYNKRMCMLLSRHSHNTVYYEISEIYNLSIVKQVVVPQATSTLLDTLGDISKEKPMHHLYCDERSYNEIKSFVASLSFESYSTISQTILVSANNMNNSEAKDDAFTANTLPQINNVRLTYIIYSLIVPLDQLVDSIVLATVSSVADMMPLVDENRSIVMQGLSLIRSTKILAFRLMLRWRNIYVPTIKTDDLAFSLIPVLNASGKQGRADQVVEFLLCNSSARARQLLDEISVLYENRRTVLNKVLGNIHSNSKCPVHISDKLLVFVDNDLLEGLTGLLANKLLSMYHCTCIVISTRGELAIGSIRTQSSEVVRRLFKEASSVLEDYGGHDYAGGFRLYNSVVQEFVRSAINLCESETSDTSAQQYDIDALLPPQYLSERTFSLVQSYEPFGKGFPKFLFLGENYQINNYKQIGKHNDHYLLNISGHGVDVSAVYWNVPQKLEKIITNKDRIDILFHLEKHYFNHHEHNRLSIVDIRKSSDQ